MPKSLINTIILVFIAVITLTPTVVFGQNSKSEMNPESAKYLRLLYPRGTEIFQSESEIIIEWEFQNVNKISIQYLDDSNNWNFIISELQASEKKIIWKIDNEITRLIKLKIVDIDDSNIYDLSYDFIEIKKSYQKVMSKSIISLEQTTSLSRIKIMPLGNSITQGYTVPVPEFRDGYRKSLKILMENNGLNVDFVGSKTDGNFNDNQHEGHGGWHSKHWYNNKKYSLADSLTKFLTLNPPNIILLHIGTNDIGEYFDSRNDNNMDTTVTEISGLLDTIYNFDPSIKVILAKIINRTDDNSTAAVNEYDTTTAFNIALQNMADIRITNGDNLSIVDMENALIYPDDLSDGVHPNSAGYDKMGQVWFNGIIDLLPKLSLKIFVEGAYRGSHSMSSNINKQNNQPFGAIPWNYSGTEEVGSIPTNVIDWVLVSLREDISKSTEVARRAGFLKKDGQIVDLDGITPLAFVVDEGSYYVVVEHRNHLPIMSDVKVSIIW